MYKELKLGLYEPKLYHKKQEKVDSQSTDSLFDIIEIPDFSIQSIKDTAIDEAEIVVISTGEEEINVTLAIELIDAGIERVICRVENLETEIRLKKLGIEVFSTLLSTKTLLRALIESPHMLNILTNEETALYEIHLLNRDYEGMTLRKFPFTGDVIFVRIFRGNDSIVPHGGTELQLYDRLIVTGTKEYVEELIQELQFESYYNI